MSKPFRHFDLPKTHLTGTNHYVPPKARSQDEIDLRRTRPSGTLLAEMQLRGIQIARDLIRAADDGPDIHFVSDVVSASALNSSWYGYAKDANVMRRRLQLPDFTDTPQLTLYMPDRKADVSHGFDAASYAARGLMQAIEHRGKHIARRRMYVGRFLGEEALRAACLPLGNAPMVEQPFVAQSIVRQQSMLALDRARAMGAELGTPPTLAQLSDPDSDLSVYVRRNAPNRIYDAYEQSLEFYRTPV
jgi:hypothetical protein